MTVQSPDPQPCSPSAISPRSARGRIVWLVNSLGYGESLLYWAPILSRYVKEFPHTRFFTAVGVDKPIPNSTHVVKGLTSIRVPLGKRRFSYDRHLQLVSPTCLAGIGALRPDVFVVSEFTVPSLYAVLYRSVRRTPILLLVESDPLRGKADGLGWFRRRLRRFIANRVDWVLTNNDAGRRYILEYLPIPAQRIMCGPYVVSEVASVAADDDAFSPRAELGDEGKLVFLSVGQIVERKGISQLVDAVAKLTGPQRDKCRFWIVGDGGQRAAVEAQIRQRGLAEIVRLLGPQPYEKLGAYYRSADVFVMPTLDDYRALAGFEALAYGLPLLHSCYDGAACEVTHEGRNGYIVDPRDPTSLVNGIQWFADHPDELSSLGEYSHSLSRQFTVEIAVQNLVEATRRCLLLFNAWNS